MTPRAARPLVVALALAAAVAEATHPPGGPVPDVKDAAYGPHPRNVLDLWRARGGGPAPLVLFAHSGGFMGGDKDQLPRPLLEGALAAGYAVASMNYRLAPAAPYPAPMEDGVRAIQFLRSRAADWGLDPARFVAAGESAGAGIVLWAAFHDERAQPGAADPVARQSSRLACVGSMNGQSSYDPRFIRARIGGSPAEQKIFPAFFGIPAADLDTPRAHALFEAASPMTYLTRDDPPAFLFFHADDVPTPLPADAKHGVVIHHPQFGVALKEKMDALGIRAVVRPGLRAARGGSEAWRQEGYADMLRLFGECLAAGRQSS